MSFNILTVRDGETTDNPLYPTPGEEADSVEPEEHDGQPPEPVKSFETLGCRI